MAKRTRRALRASKPKASPVVRARGFELVDALGKTTARLGVIPGAGVDDSGVGLVLLGQDGAPQVSLRLDGDGPSFHLSAGGVVRLSLVVLSSGDRTVLVAARDGRGREVLAATVSEHGDVVVHLTPRPN